MHLEREKTYRVAITSHQGSDLVKKSVALGSFKVMFKCRMASNKKGSSKSNSQVVCKSCLQNLKQIVEFKSNCLDIDNKIVSVSQETNKDVSEVYGKAATTDKSKSDISNGQNVCCICMDVVHCGKLVPLNSDNVDSTMLEKYFSELDLALIEDPEICPPCLKNMQQYFHDIDSYVNVIKDAQRDGLNKIGDSTQSDKRACLSEQKAASSKSRNLKQKRINIRENALDVEKLQCAHCAYETTGKRNIVRHLRRHRENDLGKLKVSQVDMRPMCI
ncbi:hypothetical protein NQ317_007621 [Molorchus minor]|uniref:ZAD domain-containing protein n=1 Tax=Molorchus minor TaxID=1323400 RepID=A0ABQ9J176_9CUCU|nr:hypothetical protein NQ317_007621 [Molorchus minor]